MAYGSKMGNLAQNGRLTTRRRCHARKHVAALAMAAAGVLALAAQQRDFTGTVTSRVELPAIAVPEFRGDEQSQAFVAAFNETLWNDLEDSGVLRLVPRSQHPKNVPQQPADFRLASPADAAPRPGSSEPPSGGGLWLQDWSTPPAQANYLAMGYTAVQSGLLVVRAWLMDVRAAAPASAEVLGSR